MATYNAAVVAFMVQLLLMFRPAQSRRVDSPVLANRLGVGDGGIARAGENTTRAGDWNAQVLAKHNEFRALHGAPPLVWSNECYTQAKAQADECMRRQSLEHGHTQGPSGRHGQNAYWGSRPALAGSVVESWYSEVSRYNFKSPGFNSGTGHFTQVVWVGTTSVGMAASADGRYIVANYLPGGNVMGGGRYEANVLPRGAAPASKPRQTDQGGRQGQGVIHNVDAGFGGRQGEGGGEEAKEGSITETRMTAELLALFEGCPSSKFKQEVADAFDRGGEVTVTRKPGSIRVKTRIGRSTSTSSGSWSEGSSGGGDREDAHRTATLTAPQRAPNDGVRGATGTVTETRMTQNLRALLVGCPYAESYKAKIAGAFVQGGTVSVDRQARSLKLTLKVGSKTSVSNASW